MHATALIMSLKSPSLSAPLAFSRASVGFIGDPLFAFPTLETIILVCEYHSPLSDLHPGSHHAPAAAPAAA